MGLENMVNSRTRLRIPAIKALPSGVRASWLLPKMLLSSFLMHRVIFSPLPLQSLNGFGINEA